MLSYATTASTKVGFSAIAAAGRGEMHYGISSCPKSPLVIPNGRSSDTSRCDMTEVRQDATPGAYSMTPCVNFTQRHNQLNQRVSELLTEGTRMSSYIHGVCPER